MRIAVLSFQPLFTEVPRRGILRSSRLTSEGGIMVVVERVEPALAQSGRKEGTCYGRPRIRAKGLRRCVERS